MLSIVGCVRPSERVELVEHFLLCETISPVVSHSETRVDCVSPLILMYARAGTSWDILFSVAIESSGFVS